jgi:predicted DNA-binding protein
MPRQKIRLEVYSAALPPQTIEALTDRARVEGKSRSLLTREILERYLSESQAA